MVRILIKSLGYCCLVFGVLGMLTPIPLGVIFFTLGLLLLIPTSPTVARWTRLLRRRSKRVDQVFAAIMRKLPSPYRRILRQTDVDSLDRVSFD